MKIIFFLTTSVLIVLQSYSIGFYEIKYSVKYYNYDFVYTGLLMFYNDSSNLNKMRIQWTDLNGNILLAEEKIKIEWKTETGIRFRLLQGYEPKMIINSPDNNTGYVPDVFIFKVTHNGYYKPDHLETLGEHMQIVDGKIISFNAITKMNDDYLRKFGWGNQQDSLVKASSNNMLIPKIVNLIILANTNDESIGTSCEENEKQIEKFFESASSVAKIKINTFKRDGKNFTVKDINALIKNLKIEESDGIILYYSGHGYRKPMQQDSFPILDFRTNQLTDIPDNSNSLDLRIIHSILKGKSPRFLITIAECCNTDLSTSVVAEKAKNDPTFFLAATTPPLNKLLVAKLLGFRGSIMVSSAHPQESSYYFPKTGGIFWNLLHDKFVSNLCVPEIKGDLTWKQLLQEVSDVTNETVHKVNTGYSENAVFFQQENY